jgi:hypothetical protein
LLSDPRFDNPAQPFGHYDPCAKRRDQRIIHHSPWLRAIPRVPMLITNASNVIPRVLIVITNRLNVATRVFYHYRCSNLITAKKISSADTESAHVSKEAV